MSKSVNQRVTEVASCAARCMPARDGYLYVIAVVKVDGSEPIATAGNASEDIQAQLLRAVLNSFEHGTDTFQGYIKVPK